MFLSKAKLQAQQELHCPPLHVKHQALPSGPPIMVMVEGNGIQNSVASSLVGKESSSDEWSPQIGGIGNIIVSSDIPNVELI